MAKPKKVNKEINYSLKKMYHIVQEAKEVGCNIEISPKVVEKWLKAQNSQTLQSLKEEVEEIKNTTWWCSDKEEMGKGFNHALNEIIKLINKRLKN